MKITFCISSLEMGGAERVMSNMANYWAEKDWEITIITMCEPHIPIAYPLHSKVKYIPISILNSKSSVRNPLHEIFRVSNFTRFGILRKAIIQSKPDIVISFLNKINISVLIATRFLDIPVIVSERSDPYQYKIGLFWDIIRKLIYLKSNLIVFQSEYARMYFKPIKFYKGIVIANPLKIENSNGNQKEILKHPNIVSLGRFTYEKGHDILIKAFKEFLMDSKQNYSLYLFGNGPYLENYKNLCMELGIQDKVIFSGYTNNSFSVLSDTDMFVLPSRNEGFPNVLCEAMSIGLPVISTETAGAKSIIINGENGILIPVEDIGKMKDALIYLSREKELKKKISNNAKTIINTLDESKIMKVWEDAISSLLIQSSG